MRNTLLYLIAGSSGGLMRARILITLKTPANAHKVAKTLGIDYKTARYHLDLLVKNNVLDIINKERYGAVYVHSAQLEAEWQTFNSIWESVGKDLGRSL